MKIDNCTYTRTHPYIRVKSTYFSVCVDIIDKFYFCVLQINTQLHKYIHVAAYIYV